MTNEKQFVIVCTKSRPWRIESGWLLEEGADHVVLADARTIVYYGTDTRGPGGIAALGPLDGRVGPRVDRATVRGVESIHVASPAAREIIESEPWS